MDVGGNTSSHIRDKNEEKAEVLNASFALHFNGKTSCSLGTQSPELRDRDGEQKEDSTIQEKRVSDLLHHLDTHRSMRLDGMH